MVSMSRVAPEDYSTGHQRMKIGIMYIVLTLDFLDT